MPKRLKAYMNGVPEPIRHAVSFLATFGMAVAALYLTDIGCLVRFATGVSCPGCGLTRAWLAALRLDFVAAFAYHPLFWTAPFIFAAAFGQHYVARGRRAIDVFMVVMAVALIVLWVARLLNPADASMFLGITPAGVPADIVGIHEPTWLVWLRVLVG